MEKNDTAYYNGHRDRLRQKFIDENLAEYELLELLLGYAIPRRDVRPLAHLLLDKFGGISQILTAPIEKLIEIDGIGKNTAVFIKSVHKLMINGYKSYLHEKPIFYDENILINYCKMLLADSKIEEFHVLYLDTNKRLLFDDLHSHGTMDRTAVYPREIVKTALEYNAKFIVLLHNHPICGTTFSQQDIDITNKLIGVLSNLEIGLYDHYLVAGGNVYSARNMLLLK